MGTLLPNARTLAGRFPVLTLTVVMGHLFGSLINLNRPGRYVHWGFIQISVANLVLIGLMVIVFVAAILIPFRRHRGGGR
jgi:hypothetical protein